MPASETNTTESPDKTIATAADGKSAALAVVPPTPSASAESTKPPRSIFHRWLRIHIVVAVIVVSLVFGIRWILDVLDTVSTDDAYVNGHVTFVAPRVPGQIMRVMVDDNNRVHQGDLLVQLDKEPYQVQVDINQAAVVAAQADLVSARASARGVVGQMRSLRFALEHAMEDVDNQIAVIRAKVAALKSKQAAMDRTQADYDRAVNLLKTGALGKEEFDARTADLLSARAQVEEAHQVVNQARATLGLPPKPSPKSKEEVDDLAQVPTDLNQTFSTVRQAQAALLQAAAQVGVTYSFNKTPRQMVEDFYKRDPQGDIDRIYEQILKDAPGIKQAESKLAQAQRNLDQAQLNLRYCDVFAEIDGVVTRRNANPGNNVVVGQNLMAVRSLTEIWIDANFKETQLAYLRIGQTVDLDADMYGTSKRFKGRISGFTMGTGSTLALLPAENATGNFVKVVQRLPVRIELMDYDPDKMPLFIGLSVTPSVRIHEQPTGPDAGKQLQPHLLTANSSPGVAPAPSKPASTTKPEAR